MRSLRARAALVALLSVTVLRCATTPSSQPLPTSDKTPSLQDLPPSEHVKVLQVVLDFFEQDKQRPTQISRFLVTDPLDQTSRLAASRLRPVITRAELPADSPWVTPPGDLVLSKLTLTGDTATVRAGLGPVAKGRPGELSLDCGEGYTLTLTRASGGSWFVAHHSVVVC